MCFALVMSAVLAGVASRSAWAVPAWARALDTKCATCHSPVPPRLNNTGLVYKRMGYRLPDADDEGNLTFKEREGKAVFDDFSLLADMRIESQKTDAPDEADTSFKLDEVEAMGGGPLQGGFSYAAEYVLYEAGDSFLETIEAQYNRGKLEGMFTVRAGQIRPSLWQKGELQKLTLRRPFMFDKRAPIGSFGGFRLRERQRGVELGYTINRLQEGQLTSTFLSGTVLNGLSQEDSTIPGSFSGTLNNPQDRDNSKDFLLQAMHVWDQSNTVGAFYYRGKATMFDDVGAGASVVSIGQNRIKRAGLVGNYVVDKKSGVDLLAGYVTGSDDTTEAGVANVDSNGWFLELNGVLKQSKEDTTVGRTVGVIRYDRFDPDDSVPGTDKGWTVGLNHQASDNILLNLEYQNDSGAAANTIIGRVLFAY